METIFRMSQIALGPKWPKSQTGRSGQKGQNGQLGQMVKKQERLKWPNKLPKI